MIYYKTRDEVERLRESSLLVSKTLAEVGKLLKPGVSLLKVDAVAEEFIRDHGAVPAFKGYHGFPNSLCISMNEAVVHGIPTDREVTDGDIVSLDCGVVLNGYVGDSAYSYALSGIGEESLKLLRATKKSLFIGIEKAIAGLRIGDLGYAIQHYIEVEQGYYIVRELVGHGVGKDLHEDPEVPNFGRRGSGPVMKEGLVIAIEPMVNLGTKKINQSNDGWTVTTADKSPSAHYELMVSVRKGEADILSTFSFIEEVELENENLASVEVENKILTN